MSVSNKKIGEVSLAIGRLKNNYGGIIQIAMILYLFASEISRTYFVDLFFTIFIFSIIILILFVLVWIFDFKKVGLAGKEWDAILVNSDEWKKLTNDIKEIKKNFQVRNNEANASGK